jgi:DNA-binding transcriptional MerR regulator
MDRIEKTISGLPDKTYFRIGEVARITKVKPYVLRFWESEFKMMAPPKSRSKQRMYRRKDIETILIIKHLLYKERFTIEGARKRLAAIRRGEEAAAGPAEVKVPTKDLVRIRRELEQLRERIAQS